MQDGGWSILRELRGLIYHKGHRPHPSDSPMPRFVGPYCVLSSELSFVLEDSEGVCGYVLGVLDSQRFYERIKKEWLPLMCSKYPPAGSKAMNRTEQVCLISVVV